MDRLCYFFLHYVFALLLGPCSTQTSCRFDDGSTVHGVSEIFKKIIISASTIRKLWYLSMLSVNWEMFH